MNKVSSVALLLAAGCMGAAGSNPTGNPSVAPNAPSSLTADPMGTGIHLIWQSNSTNEDQFEIQRSQGGAFAPLDSVPFGTTSYHDASVSPGGSYSYRVHATNQAGASPWSNVAGTTAAPAPPGDGGGPNDAGSVTGWRPDSGTVPSFARDIVPIFNNSCGSGASNCHAPNAYYAWSNQSCRGWLSLTNVPEGAQYQEQDGGMTDTGCPDLPLYQRLMQLQAWQCPVAYVTPGQPMRSYVWLKIIGGPLCAGAPTTTMPMVGSLAPNDQAAIEAWINGGAPQ
jgi:hypothetical protein